MQSAEAAKLMAEEQLTNLHAYLTQVCGLAGPRRRVAMPCCTSRTNMPCAWGARCVVVQATMQYQREIMRLRGVIGQLDPGGRLLKADPLRGRA